MRSAVPIKQMSVIAPLLGSCRMEHERQGRFRVASILIFQPTAPREVEAQSFPATINLPDGWLPEGIVVGNGHTLYSGSRRHGAVYAADLRTGEGEVVVPPQVDRIAVAWISIVAA